jgi:hypothetical protein
MGEKRNCRHRCARERHAIAGCTAWRGLRRAMGGAGLPWRRIDSGHMRAPHLQYGKWQWRDQSRVCRIMLHGTRL